jgi:hypothetical protein
MYPIFSRKIVTHQHSHPAAGVGVTKYSLPVQRLPHSLEVRVWKGRGDLIQLGDATVIVYAIHIHTKNCFNTKSEGVISYLPISLVKIQRDYSLWKGFISLTLLDKSERKR